MPAYFAGPVSKLSSSVPSCCSHLPAARAGERPVALNSEADLRVGAGGAPAVVERPVAGDLRRADDDDDPDLAPGADDGLLLGVAEQATGVVDRQVREVLELRVRGQPRVAQRRVPDLAGLLPRVAAERDRARGRRRGSGCPN